MKIFGLSLTSILFAVAIAFIARRYGNSIPIIRSF